MSQMRWERIFVKAQPKAEVVGKSPGRKGGKLGPGKKWGHTLNAVNYGRLVYVFGGYGKDERQTNDVYVYNTGRDSWSKPNIKGTPPSPRDSHTCTAVGHNLYVFGGTDGACGLNDLYMLDTTTNTWSLVQPRGQQPSPREGHAAALVGGQLFVFGGCGKPAAGSGAIEETYYNDVHVLDTVSSHWRGIIPSGPPPTPRDSHSVCAWGRKLVVFGGEDSNNAYLNDVHILDTDTMQWREVHASGSPPQPRAGHVAVTVGRHMLLFGGFTDDRQLFNDLHVLDLVNEKWVPQPPPSEDAPSRRFSLSADVIDASSGKIMLYGGCNSDLEALDDAYFLHTGLGTFSTAIGPSQWQSSIPPAPSPHAVVSPTSSKQPPSGTASVSPMDAAGTAFFQADIVDVFPHGYCLRAVVNGTLLHGMLFSSNPGFAAAASNYTAAKNADAAASEQNSDEQKIVNQENEGALSVGASETVDASAQYVHDQQGTSVQLLTSAYESTSVKANEIDSNMSVVVPHHVSHQDMVHMQGSWHEGQTEHPDDQVKAVEDEDVDVVA